MSDFFKQLSVIEEDYKRLESITKLQEGFNEVKASYSMEYNSTLEKLLGDVKTKLRGNSKMKDAVNNYVKTYVKSGMEKQAEEALYNMLAAEILGTFQALSHTSCNIC